MTSPCCPTARVLHTSRTGEVRLHDPRPGSTPLAAQAPRLPARRGGPAGRRDRPELRRRTSWVYLYYSPPLNTPVDDPATPASTRATRRTGTAADFAAFKGHIQLSRFKLDRTTRSTSRSEQKILDVPVDRGHLLPRRRRHRLRRARATCTCRPATTPTRSSPTATRRSTSAPTATRRSTRSAPRATPTTCAARCCASRSQRRRRRTRSRPATCSRRARRRPGPRSTRWACATRSASSVDQATGDVYVGDYSPGRRQRRTRPRARRARSSGRAITQAGNYGWPYCATPNDCRTSTTTSPPATSGAKFNCAAPGQRLAEQHRPARAAAGRAAGRLVLATARRPQFPRARHRRHRPDGRPGVRLRRRAPRTPRPGGLAATTTACRCSTSGPATTSRSSASTADGDAGRDRARGRRRSSSTTRWTWSSARTARSTCSSTATATSPRTRTRSSPGSTTSGGNQTPIPKVAADADRRARPADRRSSPAPARPTPTATGSRYAWDFDADGTVDSHRAEPDATRSTENGVYTRDAEGDRPHRTLRVGRTVAGRRRPTAPVVEFVTPPTAGQPFQFGDTVDVRGEGHRRPAGRLHQGHGHLRPRPRRARAPAVTTSTGCTGHDHHRSSTVGTAGADNLTAVFVAEYTDAPTARAYPRSPLRRRWCWTRPRWPVWPADQFNHDSGGGRITPAAAARRSAPVLAGTIAGTPRRRPVSSSRCPRGCPATVRPPAGCPVASPRRRCRPGRCPRPGSPRSCPAR